MAPPTPGRPQKVMGLVLGLCALAVLNTDLLSASSRALTETTRKLCKTYFYYPDWKQYWEDLFAPKASYANAGVRSLIPLQTNNIGYFLTLTSCPADGYLAGDPHDPGMHFLYSTGSTTSQFMVIYHHEISTHQPYQHFLALNRSCLL
jgi:hypothetical protein